MKNIINIFHDKDIELKRVETFFSNKFICRFFSKTTEIKSRGAEFNLCVSRYNKSDSDDFNLFFKINEVNLSLFSNEQIDQKEILIDNEQKLIEWSDYIDLEVEEFYQNKISELEKKIIHNYKKLQVEQISEEQKYEIDLFHRVVFQAFDLDSLFKIVNEFVFSNLDIRVLNLTQTLEQESLDNIFQIGSLKKYFIKTSSHSTYFYYIYSIISELCEKIQGLEMAQKNVSERLFYKIPSLLAVFDSHNNLILQNDALASLKITSSKIVDSYNKKNNLIVNSSSYRVHKEGFIFEGKEFFQYALIKLDDMMGSLDSSAELGVISSSIAHELNNPLAGMLAALDVLLLDDLDEESIEKLMQMKDVVFKCKELVQTFLAFSRRKITNAQHSMTVKKAFDQAMSLTRFRLVESNLSIVENYHCKNNFRSSSSNHLLTMTLYLLIGEIITSYSHKKLIENKHYDKICLELVEKEFSIDLNIDFEFELTTDFLNSRLFCHLLDGLGLKVLIENKSVVLLHN
ncbi:MAG: hypothetical protein N4A33_06410 [Bacteriovoracaceae bacterium]|jgi:hypothetical protein|nr:hypothetical protein [Bacteriovoracaceae bacterium]